MSTAPTGSLEISLIAALGQRREIGCNNELLWRIREDQQNFKRVTLGHVILMGRKTYESIGRPLPGRTNVILTRQPEYAAPGCEVVSSWEAAVAYAQQRGETELFVCGGTEIYGCALPYASRMYLSWIEATKSADAYFPPWSMDQWRVELEVSFPAGEAEAEGVPAWRYQVLQRLR